MGRTQGPAVDCERPAPRQCGKAPHEVGAIRVVPEDRGALNPPHHQVMGRRRPIDARLAQPGGERPTRYDRSDNVKSYPTPIC